VRLTRRWGAGGSRGVTVPQSAAWRSVLRRHLAWLLLVKFAALALLWALFFSPAHRTPVDARIAGRQLALGQAAPPARAGAPARQESRRD